ncbi:MAG: putative alpha/beta superfamily hydrolase [Phenylobacterium sp.]|jgi:predicted alpha/beta superfamily hydrolase
MLRRLFSPFISLAVSCAVLCIASTNLQAGEIIDQVLKSKILAEERKYQIRLPNGYSPQGSAKYPVLYLLDGPTHVDHVASTMEYLSRAGHMPQLLIVSIDSQQSRFRDMTPVLNHEKNPNSGGGDKFLDFIEKELIPEVEKNYPVEPFRILSGHSLTGLITFHALKTRPHLFQAHFAISPSFQWNLQHAVDGFEQFIKDNSSLKNVLFLSIANEGLIKNKDGDDMYQGFLAIRSILEQKAPKNLAWSALHFPQEEHSTIPVIGHFKAFRHLYDGWHLPFEHVAEKGFAAVKQSYQQKSKKYGYAILLDQERVNFWGYFLMGQKDGLAKARECFAYNLEHHPKSASAHDSMADLLEKEGRIIEALAMMNKAVKLVDKQDADYEYIHQHRDRLNNLVTK